MKRTLATLYHYELLQLVRDRRTLFVAVVAPLLLLPGVLFLMRASEGSDEARRRDTVYRYAVTGRDTAQVASLVSRAVALELPDTGGAPPLLDLERVSPPDPSAALESGALHLVVAGLPPARNGLPRLEIRFRSSSDLSSTAAARLEARMERLRLVLRDSLYRAGGLPVSPADVMPVEDRNVAEEGREAGAFLGLVLPPLLITLMLTGGSIVAADTLSGEKERGTLETLLTTAASRQAIVEAKALAIMTVGAVVTLINVLNVAAYIGLGLVDVPEGMAVTVSIPVLVALLLLFLPVAALVAGALLLTSGWAKSYREYQLYFFPVFLLLLAPTGVALLPGLELRSAVLLVPIANVTLAVRDILSGQPDVVFSVLAGAVTLLFAVVVERLAEGTLSTERLLSDSEADRAALVGGPSLFPYRVGRWFGLMWVAFLLLSFWMEASLDIRSQLAVNLIGLFLLSSILMIWLYRLPVREALALRGVHPLVWPAVLVGAPCAFVLGLGVAEAAGVFLPVPPRVVEAFGEFILPEDMGLGQMLFFLAVLPGICEEVAFRGLLLHGLRRRMGPVALCLTVGAVFGVFHVALFRILPTAYLGVVLAAVVVLTGSILPAILWHALNNATALLPEALGWSLFADGVPAWSYPVALVGLLACLEVMRRLGRGYPGVTAPEASPPDARPERAAPAVA